LEQAPFIDFWVIGLPEAPPVDPMDPMRCHSGAPNGSPADVKRVRLGSIRTRIASSHGNI